MLNVIRRNMMSSYFYNIYSGHLTEDQADLFEERIRKTNIDIVDIGLDTDSLFYVNSEDISGSDCEFLSEEFSKFLQEVHSNEVFTAHYSGDDEGYQLLDKEGVHDIDVETIVEGLRKERHEKLTQKEETLAPHM